MQHSVINPAHIRAHVIEAALDSAFQLKVMPANFYTATTRTERAYLGHTTASYVLPTHELISALRERIGDRPAIEIASGNGLVAGALGIPATDNHLQTLPEVAAIYSAAGQPTITYGANVERLDALQAVRKYKPRVVVACWYTHRYNPAEHWRGGSVYSNDEIELLSEVDEYILVGNTSAHAHKPLLQRQPAWVLDSPPFLFSRSNSPSREFVIGWRR